MTKFNVKECINSNISQQIHVRIPKFQIKVKYQMKKILKRLLSKVNYQEKVILTKDLLVGKLLTKIKGLFLEDLADEWMS